MMEMVKVMDASGEKWIKMSKERDPKTDSLTSEKRSWIERYSLSLAWKWEEETL